jgi:hypothetical protein
MRRQALSDAPLMNKLMQSILEFLTRSGMRGEDVEQMFTECLQRLNRRTEPRHKIVRDAHYVGNGNVSAEVIRIWHRDGRFLDREARPRPLQLNRGAKSLGALVKRLDPESDHMQSIRAMRAVGLIRRLADGRYVPTAESVKIDHLHPLAIEHIAKSVVRLVTTVCRNTDPSRQAMSLIERYAYVPDLSKAEASAFAEFTRSQGMAYLEAVDDWLEQRRIGRVSHDHRTGRTKGIAAGVHLFAYLGDNGDAANKYRARVSVKRLVSRSMAVAGRGKSSLTSSRAIRA